MTTPSQNHDKAKQAKTTSDTGAALSAKEQWLEENRASMLAWNDWVQQNGMPYDEYRHFDFG